jgi:hypothetical protein
VAAVNSRQRFQPGQTLVTIPVNRVTPVEVPEEHAWLHERRLRERQLATDYFAKVPDDVRSMVEAFPARQWHVLAMLARCEGALDLLLTNPALAYCLATCWVFTGSPSKTAMRQIRRLVARRRKNVAGALGFPATDSAVAVLAKTDRRACAVPWLLSLRQRLGEPEAHKTLLHLPVLSAPVMTIVCSGLRSFVAPSFLHQLAAASTEDSEVHVRLLGDTLRMLRQMDDSTNARFWSLRQLHRTHNSLVERINCEQTDELLHYHFPGPPLPGTEQIVPLCEPRALLDEGRTMHHCAASYAPDVAAGGAYFYRVLAPERATLLLRREGSQWGVGEISGPCNQRVSAETLCRIGDWLSLSWRAAGIDTPF